MTETITPSSSWVQSVTYDEDHEHLLILTKEGKTISKVGVTGDVWLELKSAPSAGKFISARVIGVYENG